MNVAHCEAHFEAAFLVQSPRTRLSDDYPNRQKVIRLEASIFDFAQNCALEMVYILCATAARDLEVNKL